MRYSLVWPHEANIHFIISFCDFLANHKCYLWLQSHKQRQSSGLTQKNTITWASFAVTGLVALTSAELAFHSSAGKGAHACTHTRSNTHAQTTQHFGAEKHIYKTLALYNVNPQIKKGLYFLSFVAERSLLCY